jgi:2-oxoglutarate dehydrogenase E1 component
VVLCSGKVYYELLDARRENDIDDIAIVRIEQLYPFPYVEFRAVLESYTNVERVVWCQEEPRNQGTWYNNRHRMGRIIHDLGRDIKFTFAGRDPSASPAAGYTALHVRTQTRLVRKALNLPVDD